jgi:hypothetical protein
MNYALIIQFILAIPKLYEVYKAIKKSIDQTNELRSVEDIDHKPHPEDKVTRISLGTKERL